MIVKAVMIMWLGYSDTLSVTITDFDSIEICNAAKAAMLVDEWVDGSIKKDKIHCVPYKVEN